MAERVGPMVAWTMGAFHTAVLMVAAVFLLHLGGNLGGFLGGLSTQIGVVAYFALWAVMWAIARWVTRDVAWTADGPAEPEVLVNGAIFAGGALGAGVLLTAVIALAAPGALANGLGSAAGFLFFAVVGGCIAFLFGAIVGGVLVAVDLGLVRVARRMLHG